MVKREARVFVLRAAAALLAGAKKDDVFPVELHEAADEVVNELHDQAAEEERTGLQRASSSMSASAAWLKDNGARIDGDIVVWPDGERFARTRRIIRVATTEGGERPPVCSSYRTPEAGNVCARCGWPLDAHPAAVASRRAQLCAAGCVVATWPEEQRVSLHAEKGICDDCPLKEEP